jgi:hypothetical protein
MAERANQPGAALPGDAKGLEFEAYIRNKSGVYSEVRRAIPAGRNDQHRIRRTDNQPSREPVVRQAATTQMLIGDLWAHKPLRHLDDPFSKQEQQRER